MKILYLVSSQGIHLNMKGGAGTHIRGTIHGFEMNGHQVLPMIFGDIKLDKNNLKDNGLGIPSLKKNENLKKYIPNKIRIMFRDIRMYFYSKKVSNQILPAIIEFSPDFIYERSCLYSMAGSMVSKKLKVPLFLETSGCLVEIFEETYGLTSRYFANWIEKKKLENADVVVTEAESAVEFIKNKYKISPKRIIAKPLGIQIPSKNFSNMDLNFKENVLNLGYVGTFASYHNVELLQPVFKYFKNKKIIFYLIGSGGNIKKIKNWVEDNEIVNVIFTGYLENEKLIQYLNFLDIGIVPNCEKHMAPIKTFEYGVYNICPMVPEYDAFSKIIKNKENGIIFKPNSPDSIIKNIDDVLKGDIEYKQCGSNWNKFVLNTFQWHQVVRNVLFEAEKL